MKKKYDFSKGIKGKFYKPRDENQSEQAKSLTDFFKNSPFVNSGIDLTRSDDNESKKFLIDLTTRFKNTKENDLDIDSIYNERLE